MKNTKRAYRREKASSKFNRRIKIWIATGGNWRYNSTEEFRLAIKKGEVCTFLRTTLNPCACCMCQGYKYVRIPKFKQVNYDE